MPPLQTVRLLIWCVWCVFVCVCVCVVCVCVRHSGALGAVNQFAVTIGILTSYVVGILVESNQVGHQPLSDLSVED